MKTERKSAIFGWAASVVLHASLVAWIIYKTSTPDLGFDFQLPNEVEFGLTEAVTVTQGATPPSQPAQQASRPGEGEGDTRDGGVPRDAAVADGGVPRDAGALVAQGEGAEGEGPGSEGHGHGVAFLPAGSQIALRIDLARVRRSPLAPAVRNALTAIPDWQSVLAGSGIDPVNDLDRLLVASPNLDPSRIIAAGRTSGDEASIRAAAERMAAANGNGATVTWRTEQGVPVTDWHDRSGFERIIALIGPRHFVIARPADLPRIMAVARVRASQPQAEGEPPREHPADALLSMHEGEGLSLEVEGFRNFASARQQGPSADLLPTRLRLGIAERGPRIAAEVTGRFDNEEQASAAAPHWDRILREQVAPNPAISFAMNAVGAGGVLPRIQMNNRGETVSAGVDMSMSEMRGVLGLVPMVLSMRAARRPPRPVPVVPRGPSAPPPGAPPSTPTPSAPPAPEPPPAEPAPEPPAEAPASE